MLVQEVLTDIPESEVIGRAKAFFTGRASQYTGLIAEEGPSHARFEIEAGELVIGVLQQDGRTLVRGSTSRLHHELSQFLTTLAPAEEVRQNAVGPGSSGAG